MSPYFEYIAIFDLYAVIDSQDIIFIIYTYLLSLNIYQKLFNK